MEDFNYPTKKEIFSIIAKTTFRKFDKADWHCFSGCESKEPMIGEYGDITIVIDGETINMVHQEDEYGSALYSLEQLA